MIRRSFLAGFCFLLLAGCPKPTVEPPAPDEFGNVAQAIAAYPLSDETKSFANQMAFHYYDVASRLEGTKDPLIVTVEEAAEAARDANARYIAGQLGAMQYRQVRQELTEMGEMIATHWDPLLPKDAAVRFFRAVATGLKCH